MVVIFGNSVTKERDFAQDFLAFASQRHGANAIKDWTVTVQHIPDTARWVALYRVARHSGQDPYNWETCDAWSFAWDVVVVGAWVHVRNPTMRRQLADRMELASFDPSVAAKAVQYDLVIFVNDPLTSLPIHDLGLGYIKYLIAHEVLHWISDWTSKQLVRDGVRPEKDRVVVSTLDAFLHSRTPELIAERYF